MKTTEPRILPTSADTRTHAAEPLPKDAPVATAGHRSNADSNILNSKPTIAGNARSAVGQAGIASAPSSETASYLPDGLETHSPCRRKAVGKLSRGEDCAIIGDSSSRGRA